MNEIYYFTGTGNSLQIAKDLKRELSEARLKKIAEYKGEQVTADSVGVVFPVYNWGAPIIVREFLQKLNVRKGIYLYAIANYGGLPGKAIDQCKEELETRGFRLSAGFLVQMPGNYILGYGAKSDKKQKKLFQKEKVKIQRIAPIIKQKKTKKIEKSHTIVDRIFNNHYYKEVTEFHAGDCNFHVNASCVNCGLCANHCPVNNIMMTKDGPKWQHHCERCLACLQSCPKEAIDFKDMTKGKKRYVNPQMSW